MNYKDYYDKSIPDKMPLLLKYHLLNKFEKYAGIVEIISEGHPRYIGTSNKEVLVKSIEYNNEKENSSAKWFYIKDIKVPEEN